MADKAETLVAGHKAADPKYKEEESGKVAGRDKAAIVGGMRVKERPRTSHTDRSSPIVDCTGLAPSPDIDNKTVSGAKVDETTAFTAKSARVAHEPPPPKHVAAHSINRINQPK